MRNAHLPIVQAVAAFDFIYRSLRLRPHWSLRDDFVHDLAVMFDQRDLKHVSLEVIARDRKILYRHGVCFGNGGDRRVVDAAQGIELPLIPREQIADHRLLVGPTARIAEYRSMLRMNWTAAERLERYSGDEFDTKKGKVFAFSNARRTAHIVTVHGDGEYAFARDAELPTDVFLHRSQCATPFAFRIGATASFVPVQTPRGIQGRCIRPA
jgi:hypothetical protein